MQYWKGNWKKRAFSSPTRILTINRQRKKSSFRWKHKLYFLYLWLEVSPNFTTNATSELLYKLFKATTTRFGLMNGFLQCLKYWRILNLVFYQHSLYNKNNQYFIVLFLLLDMFVYMETYIFFSQELNHEL